MQNKDYTGIINHDGIVQTVNEKAVIVSISATSACSGCHAESYCMQTGKEEKLIEVRGNYSVKTGDNVTIQMSRSMGYTAVFLGYIFPLIAVVTILIILVSMKVPELPAGLISLSILIPYYIIIYFLRSQINEKFTFTLKT